MTNYEQVSGDSCDEGTYVITTVNGSIYEVIADLDRAATMQRMLRAAPADPTVGLTGAPLYGDGEVIPLHSWSAHVGNSGAVFVFYAEDARQCARVEDYPGTIRRTSAVVSIEHIPSKDAQ